MQATPKNTDNYSEAEADRRMNETLRRALTSPHKPNQAFVGKKAKPDSAKRGKAKSRGRAKPKSA
jgi:hypothetical protein